VVMTEHEIFVRFADLVEESSGVPASEITNEAALADDLGIDSLSMVEIVFAAQEAFNVKIPDEALKELKTVQDAVNYVQRMQRSGASA
jgi:acyl carrier protein